MVVRGARLSFARWQAVLNGVGPARRASGCWEGTHPGRGGAGGSRTGEATCLVNPPRRPTTIGVMNDFVPNPPQFPLHTFPWEPEPDARFSVSKRSIWITFFALSVILGLHARSTGHFAVPTAIIEGAVGAVVVAFFWFVAFALGVKIRKTEKAASVLLVFLGAFVSWVLTLAYALIAN